MTFAGRARNFLSSLAVLKILFLRAVRALIDVRSIMAAASIPNYLSRILKGYPDRIAHHVV